jgi:membrane protease subunit (stomatin/prohibitin family)
MPEILKLIEFRDRDGVYAAWRWRSEETTDIIKWDQLVVRENQWCVLMQEGKVVEMVGPGRYVLDSKNFPLLTKFFTGLVFGRGVTPYIGDVYFLNTTQFNARRWGTASPVLILDELYGQVPVTANGTAGYAVVNADTFLRKVIGTQDCVTVDELDRIARDTVIVPSFVDAVVGLSKVKIQDVINARTTITADLTKRVGEAMDGYGLRLSGLSINSIGTTPEFEAIMADAALSRAKASANAFGISRVADAQTEAEKKLRGVNSTYREVTVADAVKAAAGSGGGSLMAALLVSQLAQGATVAPSVPPPMSQAPMVQFYVALNGQQAGPFQMVVLQQMIAAGTLTTSTLVWRAGLDGWQAAGTIPDLAGLFAPPMPPPLPPAK